MIDMLLEPFGYGYMVNAMWVSALVGCICGFPFRLSHAEGLVADRRRASPIPSCPALPVPTCWALPFAAGAFLSGGLAAAAMLFLNRKTRLKEDAIIGMIFSSFFGSASSWSRSHRPR